ncbi:ribosomal RNA processing protein 1 homolog A [Danio rerio]|uniref:Ribosomal RNA processing protein 1 homolog A n=1 Tax=Danio rerio TaxID=7955 RepID=A0A8M9QJV2_DANRE
MATQAAEVIFAQKLAANEKSVRSKALLKLRKYIRIRSERAPGGFSEEELLKIWKGLFYCLWMQDLPLLQEELSTKISALLFSFRTVDSQFLFFKTFLQTMKREWNGIDRLRLDKFYQLVRFVFRQMFEMLKKQEWEPSVLQEFLQLFSDQLLQSSSAAPSGLIMHIMELYMTELAAVGAAELTAAQNLSLIEPFCRTMSRTRDRVLLKAIGSSIFSTIVDQVPFAIADLLREISTTEEEDQDGETQTNDAEENTSHPGEDAGDKGSDEAVLQFDYGAVADRLFEVASHSNIPSFNRSQIYKFVKVFRDLSEGVFPQDEVEDVSSDEDEFDDDRRRKKKKKKSSSRQQDSLNTHTGEAETSTPADDKPKNKKRRKKKKKSGLKSVEEPENCTAPQTPAEDQKKKKKTTQQHTETADGGQQRSETHTTPALMEDDGGAPAEKPQKKKKRKMQTPAEADQHTLMKRRKKSLHTHTNGDAPIEETTAEKPQKKNIQKPLNGHTQKPQKKKMMMQITNTPLTTEKPQKKKLSQKRAAAALVNGHTEAEDPALPVSTDRKMKKKFVLSQKKAPAPLFCKGLKNTRISAAAKTDRKKVTFGLKNNKTVEFRKTDRSALLSPDRLPFDPSRTPKSGVLKTPSPSAMKRPSAADFF